MCTLLLIGGIVLAIVGALLLDLTDEISGILIVVGVVAAVIGLAVGIWFGAAIANNPEYVLNEQISALEEQNRYLEQVAEMLGTQDSAKVVAGYHQDSASTLLIEQYEQLQKNSAEISRLRVRLAKLEVWKWWLFFGQKEELVIER